MERKGARLASFGVFVALALIFSYIETLIPFQIGIPGVKLGLANLVIVIALYRMPVGEVYLLSGVRVVLTGFLFGNLMSILYSLAGGILSLTVMWGMKRIRSVSILGVSIAGPQCRAAFGGGVDGGDIWCLFVFACTADLRTFDRICHRVSGR